MGVVAAQESIARQSGPFVRSGPGFAPEGSLVMVADFRVR